MPQLAVLFFVLEWQTSDDNTSISVFSLLPNIPIRNYFIQIQVIALNAG
jgi:hypothetical protein